MQKKCFVKLTIALLVFGWSLTINGQENLTGQQIIENVYNRPTGNDRTSDLTMVLRNSRGNERVRKISQFEKDMGATEKKIMFFTYPADVKNTSFMNWSYDDENKDDDQWIYLPELKKIKRISSESKSDYFMGSDFTYDDLGDRHPSKDNHNYIKDEIINGETYLVVESYPKEEDYMYSKTITWITKDKWIGLKKEFYDEDGDLLKILHIKKSEKIDGYWIITESEMHNIQKDHTTILKLDNIKINTGIANAKFSERIMKKGL